MGFLVNVGHFKNQTNSKFKTIIENYLKDTVKWVAIGVAGFLFNHLYQFKTKMLSRGLLAYRNSEELSFVCGIEIGPNFIGSHQFKVKGRW